MKLNFGIQAALLSGMLTLACFGQDYADEVHYNFAALSKSIHEGDDAPISRRGGSRQRAAQAAVCNDYTICQAGQKCCRKGTNAWCCNTNTSCGTAVGECR
jgi:hypothetical protein